MSALLALLLVTPPVQTVPARRPSPLDWDAMPALPLRSAVRVEPAMSNWVAGELRARCPQTRRNAVLDRRLIVDVAVLVSEEDGIRATIPRAIDCPTVEQYAAGLVTSFARRNLIARPGGGSGWHRATLIFEWP